MRGNGFSPGQFTRDIVAPKNIGKEENLMPSCIKQPFLALALLLALATESAVASVTIGGGSVVNFADGTFDFGCQDLAIAGQASGTAETLRSIVNLIVSSGGGLAPGAGSIWLGGDFTNAGTFMPATSRVNIVDPCGNGTSQVSGATNFYEFAVVSNSGKQLVLPAGVTQTVSHALTFLGVAGKLLNIVSSATGTKALLTVSSAATQTIGYVDARDNDASGGATIAPGTPAQYHSVDSGRLINWFGSSGMGGVMAQAPLLGTAGRLILLFGFLFVAIKVGRKSQREIQP